MSDDDDFDFSKKKKKKPKPQADRGQDETPEPTKPDADALADDLDDALDFSGKKKKSKSKVTPKPGGQDEGEADEPSADADAASDGAASGDEAIVDETGFVSIPAGREYKYEELLDRMYSLLMANNPELAGDRKRFLMKPPQVVREGSRRVVIINFGDICKTLNRSSDHVFAFMLSEMGTTGSIDASMRMVIKGRFPPKAVEQIIRRYVVEYVSCSSCKSPNTALQKSNRLYFMQCNNCGARRSVAPIKTGFVAVSRGARRAKRAA